MFRRTGPRLVSMRRYTNLELEPYTIKSIFLFGFIGSIAFLSSYAVRETKKAGPLDLPDDLQNQRDRHNDPRRPPWPLLHQRVVLLREGKGSAEDIPLIWEQTRHYYAHDWLIPLELTQVLKYSTGNYLQNCIADPDQLRREMLMQLLDVKYDRVKDPSGTRINKEVEEIINMTIDDLEHMDLNPSANAVLVPRPT